MMWGLSARQWQMCRYNALSHCLRIFGVCDRLICTQSPLIPIVGARNTINPGQLAKVSFVIRPSSPAVDGP